MARNGSGIYSLPAGNPVVTGTTISSTWANNTLSDIATALTASIAKDGQTTATANLPMGTFRHTNVGNGVARTDYAALGQVQNSSATLIGTISGADTITGVMTPTLTAYTTGQSFKFVSAGANTGAVTLNIDSLGAKSVTKLGATALAAGDIPSGSVVYVVYDGTQFQLVGLVAQSLASGATATTQSQGDNSTKIATTAYADRAAVRSAIQPLPTPTLATNAMTIPSANYTLDFRNATLGTGGATTITGAPSALTIPSGATLGTTNAVLSSIIVIVLNNAGTLEYGVINLSGGNDLTETGVISTTAISAASSSASVFYSNSARTNVAYRVVGRIDSTQATAGTWATAPSLVQGAGGLFKLPFASEISVFTANGNGSTNTSVTRFSTVNVSRGSDITYADSATLGGSFTINTSGTYSVTYVDALVGAGDICIAINSTGADLTAFPLTLQNILAEATTGGANQRACASATRFFPAGTIVRAQTITAHSSTRQYFSIARVS